MLEGKTAVVTGSRSGIGNAIVRALAKEGAMIYAHARTFDEKFEQDIQGIEKETGGIVKTVYFDLSNPKEIKDELKNLISVNKNIDILVNNAAILGENRLFQMTTIAQMKDVFEVNFFAAMQVTQMISRIMCRNKSGSIVNIASVAGLDGDPAQLEYSCSKAALICATKKLAIELGRSGIRVNAVAPGLTDTSMLCEMRKEIEERVKSSSILQRRANPEEIANAVVFLVSDRASFITGQTLRVDGGKQI